MEFFAVFLLLAWSLVQIILAFFTIEEQEERDRIIREILVEQEIASRRMERMERKIDKRKKNNERMLKKP